MAYLFGCRECGAYETPCAKTSPGPCAQEIARARSQHWLSEMGFGPPLPAPEYPTPPLAGSTVKCASRLHLIRVSTRDVPHGTKD